MDLIKVLEDRVKQRIKNENSSQIGPLSGSNALLFDDYHFESEGPDHCPRFALLRRAGNIQEEKSIKSFISNNHGRTFEDFLKTVLNVEIHNENFEFLEEEEVEVKLEDEYGNTILTARPDKVIKYKNSIYPIEIKTIQSNSTAYSVFIKNKPKLGALIQIAIYLIGHQLTKGFVLYCASNWFGGFAGRTRWKVEPSFKVFEIELLNGDIYCNKVKTIVNYNKIIKGCYRFIDSQNKNELPPRPVWVDVEGGGSDYVGCTYCFACNACDYADANLSSLTDFFDKTKELKNEVK